MYSGSLVNRGAFQIPIGPQTCKSVRRTYVVLHHVSNVVLYHITNNSVNMDYFKAGYIQK